jgi:hypothetical protein
MAHFNLVQARNLYDEIELAILFDWMQLERPRALYNIDLSNHWESANAGSGPIRLRHSYDGFGEDNAAANAVARLVLQTVADRLPQWAVFYEDHPPLFARDPMPVRRSKVSLVPQHLLTINWADSGPGFSWPEAYYATHLPGFDVYVVTASPDSPDLHGYTDLAIGFFESSKPFKLGLRQVLETWWRNSTQGDPAQAWAYLFDTGAVGSDEAWEWARSVWPDMEQEEY